MRGICKCDLCGNVYSEKENPVYDGKTRLEKTSFRRQLLS